MTTWVLISGRRCAGKDTVAEILLGRLGPMGGTRVAFADLVKREAADKHGLDLERLLDNSRESREYKEEHRTKLIALAMEARERDPDHWVALAWKRYQNTPIVVVSDWRFDNETAYLRARVGHVICVRVEAADGDRAARGWMPNPAVDASASEQLPAIDAACIHVHNPAECTFTDLAAALEPVADAIYRPRAAGPAAPAFRHIPTFTKSIFDTKVATAARRLRAMRAALCAQPTLHSGNVVVYYSDVLDVVGVITRQESIIVEHALAAVFGEWAACETLVRHCEDLPSQRPTGIFSLIFLVDRPVLL